jgi:phage shock protein A
MLEELNVQIIDVKEKLRTRRNLQAALASARQRLAQERARCSELEGELERENADVAKLEGLSLTGLFATILGSKEEQLEKERQEVLAAKLRYDTCTDAISALEREVADLQHQIARLGDLDARYQDILDRKEELMAKAGAGHAGQLLQLSESLADARSDVRELDEAISAGNQVLDGLDHAIASLKSAGGWGMWDLLGGGIVATAVKHSRIDDARASIHRVQELLWRFRRELGDVEADSDVSVDLSSFEAFADYFFDGLIVDWIVQSRIEHSLEKAVRMQDTVQQVMGDLHARLGKAQDRARALTEERLRLIEGV